MNEKFSFKMGVRCAASLNMSENFLDILYKVMYRNAAWDRTTINMKISQIDKDERY